MFRLLVVAVAVAWLVLYLSSSAVLIGSEIRLEPGESHRYLRCQYFTGTGVIERQFWYSETGVMGRDVCARLISLR
jgi:hypothetical protein